MKTRWKRSWDEWDEKPISRWRQFLPPRQLWPFSKTYEVLTPHPLFTASLLRSLPHRLPVPPPSLLPSVVSSSPLSELLPVWPLSPPLLSLSVITRTSSTLEEEPLSISTTPTSVSTWRCLVCTQLLPERSAPEDHTRMLVIFTSFQVLPAQRRTWSRSTSLASLPRPHLLITSLTVSTTDCKFYTFYLIAVFESIFVTHTPSSCTTVTVKPTAYAV